jgi:hypothetical protein
MTRRRILIGLVAAVGCTGLAVGLSRGTNPADAQSAPFPAVPAVGNIAALERAPVSNAPATVLGLGANKEDVHQLGQNGYAWGHGNGTVCLLMSSGSGGCFSRFTKPVVLFMSGSTSDLGEQLSARAEGVVPNSVVSIDIVLDSGQKIPVQISENSFQSELPLGRSIEGLEVTLRNGKTFFDSDPLSPFKPR